MGKLYEQVYSQREEGTSKGKLELAGIGGVLRASTGNRP